MVEINEREGCHDFHFCFGIFFFFFLSSPILFSHSFLLLVLSIVQDPYICMCVCVFFFPFSYLLSHSTILYSFSLPFIIFSSLLYFLFFLSLFIYLIIAWSGGQNFVFILVPFSLYDYHFTHRSLKKNSSI